MAYKIYGTNESYTGMVVGPIGGYFYTTRGGTLEGDSKQVYEENVRTMSTEENVTTMAERAANNPVVRTFVSRVIYYSWEASTSYRRPIWSIPMTTSKRNCKNTVRCSDSKICKKCYSKKKSQ